LRREFTIGIAHAANSIRRGVGVKGTDLPSAGILEIAVVRERGLKAPIYQKHAENEDAIQAVVVDELLHGLRGMQLRVNDSFHTQAYSQ
jgi:hypothetical protein